MVMLELCTLYIIDSETDLLTFNKSIDWLIIDSWIDELCI